MLAGLQRSIGRNSTHLSKLKYVSDILFQVSIKQFLVIVVMQNAFSEMLLHLIHVSIMFFTNMLFLYKYCVYNLKNDIEELKRELDVQTCQRMH